MFFRATSAEMRPEKISFVIFSQSYNRGSTVRGNQDVSGPISVIKLLAVSIDSEISMSRGVVS